MGGDSGTVTSGAFCSPPLLRAESVVLLGVVVDKGGSLGLLGVPAEVRLLLLLEVDLEDLEGLAIKSVLLLFSGDSTLTNSPNPSKLSLPNLNSGLVLETSYFSTVSSSSATMSITLFLPIM